MAVEAKICGLTRAEDAALAVAHGASYLGVILADGPRLVDAARAREIVEAAEDVPVFGVFRTQTVGTILKLVRTIGLSGVQLHGEYDTDAARQLAAAGLVVWRVALVDPSTVLREVLAETARAADALVVEPNIQGGSGGRGVPLALGLAKAARLAAPAVRFVLAGGLTPDTVRDAIRVVRPDVVDVSSGVEISPGIKDPERLVRFLGVVRDTRPAA